MQWGGTTKMSEALGLDSFHFIVFIWEGRFLDEAYCYVLLKNFNPSVVKFVFENINKLFVKTGKHRPSEMVIELNYYGTVSSIHTG